MQTAPKKTTLPAPAIKIKNLLTAQNRLHAVEDDKVSVEWLRVNAPVLVQAMAISEETEGSKKVGKGKIHTVIFKEVSAASQGLDPDVVDAAVKQAREEAAQQLAR